MVNPEELADKSDEELARLLRKVRGEKSRSREKPKPLTNTQKRTLREESDAIDKELAARKAQQELLDIAEKL